MVLLAGFAAVGFGPRWADVRNTVFAVAIVVSAAVLPEALAGMPYNDDGTPRYAAATSWSVSTEGPTSGRGHPRPSRHRAASPTGFSAWPWRPAPPGSFPVGKPRGCTPGERRVHAWPYDARPRLREDHARVRVADRCTARGVLGPSAARKGSPGTATDAPIGPGRE